MATSSPTASPDSKRVRRKPDAGESRLDDKVDIDELPDEILVLILSRLELKEAVKTCVLSRRWTELWKFTTGSLDLEAPEALDNLFKTGEAGVSSFVKWVNSVLKMHKGRCIDKFRVRFKLDQNSSADIDNWVSFAMSKGVKRLDLNFGSYSNFSPNKPYYAFPCLDLRQMALKNSNGCISRCAYSCELVSLRFSYVDISEEVLEGILSNCRVLEELCVFGSYLLKNLKVAGQSLSLKCLEVSECCNLENLEIDTTNLKSFEYAGRRIPMPFKNVSPLSELSIGGIYSDIFIKEFPEHINYFTQLNTLKLELHYEVANLPLVSLELEMLRHLEITIYTGGNQCLLWCTSLIKASPLLHKFVAHLIIYGVPSRMFSLKKPPLWSDSPTDKVIRDFTRSPHQCLKMVEVNGFLGSRCDTDLVFHLFEIAICLEKITVNPRLFRRPGHPRHMFWDHTHIISKRKAQQLRSKLPPGAELVVIDPPYT